jgi:FAD/FMN-containing dehydrogenase
MTAASLHRAPTSSAMTAFAAEVGASGPVRVVGGRTHWAVGRRSEEQAREVRAPDGVVEVQPDELIVRCGAATPVCDLDAALASARLQCPLDPADPVHTTVGGVLSVGHSGLRRLRHGHVRDLLLEANYVAADGRLRRAGAPLVKNVTGFDLCRLLVGSLGTLAAPLQANLHRRHQCIRQQLLQPCDVARLVGRLALRRRLTSGGGLAGHELLGLAHAQLAGCHLLRRHHLPPG